MAGWALHYQNNEEPAAPWGWLRSAYIFLCLFYVKCHRWFRNAPGRLSHKIKSFVYVLLRLYDATSPYKNLVKKPNLIVSAVSTVFEGGGDGRGFGSFIFWQCKAHSAVCVQCQSQSTMMLYWRSLGPMLLVIIFEWSSAAQQRQDTEIALPPPFPLPAMTLISSLDTNSIYINMPQSQVPYSAT